jgi:predicted HAD superfamily Cof-like phosphohydrolase
VPPDHIRKLRITLIREEFEEFARASDNFDIVEVADALADLLVVVNGAALAWGIALEPIFAEVHRSNMTKDGGLLREDGKILKGPDFSPPNLEPLLESQIPEEGSIFGVR